MSEPQEALDIHLATLMSQTTRVSNTLADLDKSSAVAQEQRRQMLEVLTAQSKAQASLAEELKAYRDEHSLLKQEHALLKQRVDNSSWWGKTALGASIVALGKVFWGLLFVGGGQ